MIRLPLSFEDIKKKSNKNSPEIEAITLIDKKSFSSPEALKEAVATSIFKNVYDEWKQYRGVVVGNKLLTDAKILDFEIKNQAPIIKNQVVVHIKTSLFIKHNPEYTQDLKNEKKEQDKKKKNSPHSI